MVQTFFLAVQVSLTVLFAGPTLRAQIRHQTQADDCMDNLSLCSGDCRDTPHMAAALRLGAERVAIIVRADFDPSTGSSTRVFPIGESEVDFSRVIKVH